MNPQASRVLRNSIWHVGLILFGWTGAAFALTSPSSIVGKVYEVRLSAKSDCTAAITVFKSASPVAVDFMANPKFGDGAIPNGTYRCLAIRLSDVVMVTPQSNDGANCHAGVPFTHDLYLNAGTGDVSYSPEGTQVPATGAAGSPSEDIPWVYFSDSPIAAPTNTCFLPPFAVCACVNAGACPFTPVVVSGDQTHTLVINFDNKVGDFGNGRCEVQFPRMSIQ